MESKCLYVQLLFAGVQFILRWNSGAVAFISNAKQIGFKLGYQSFSRPRDETTAKSTRLIFYYVYINVYVYYDVAAH